MKKNNLVKYEIKQTHPGIFAVKVDENYPRAMLFLRYQEHYESAFPEIKGKHFDIFEYMEIYRKWKGVDFFSYPRDWAGYNIPGELVESCLNYVLDARNGILPTQYDYIMADVIKEVKSHLKPGKRYYILGVDTFESKTMNHEVCHGLFYVNTKYKKGAINLVLGLPRKMYDQIEAFLLEIGYCDEVIVDEIQAFMSTGLVGGMLKIKGIKKEMSKFEKHFEKYKK